MESELSLQAAMDILIAPIRAAIEDFSECWSEASQDKVPESDIQAIGARYLIRHMNFTCEREVSIREWDVLGSQERFDWVIRGPQSQLRTPIEIKVVRDGSSIWNLWNDVVKVSKCKANLEKNRARPICVALAAEHEKKDIDVLIDEHRALQDQKFADTELIFSEPWGSGKNWRWMLVSVRHDYAGT